MQKFYQSLGTAVREARVRKGFTQLQLAEMVNTTDKTIQNIENYRANPRFDLLIQLIQILNIPADLIFHPDGIESTDPVEVFISEYSKCNIGNRKLVESVMANLFSELRRLK